MNTGIVVSFIIGGLLLISIITLNSRVSENSGEMVLNMTAKTTVETVTQVMTRDFIRIAYNTGNDPTDAITFISDQRITFQADINNDNNLDPVEITWQANPGDSVSTTENPNDFKLTRTVSAGPEQGTTTFAVTDFNFLYFNQDDSPTSDPSEVRSIKVAMEVEAPGKYVNRNTYEKSLWKKTFTPPNLNFVAYN